MNNQFSFYSNCGFMHSESTAALRKFCKNSREELQTDDCENNQTHLQNVSNVNAVKNFFISNESIHVVKLNTLRKRMLITLNGIESFRGDIPQPDGVEDMKRRQQRATEFSSRFCRNYLYPLQRQMNVITKMWKNLSLNHTHSVYFSLCQKVIASHQNAQLALQAYLHHMPCSVEKGVPDKLEELLQVIKNLCSFCSKLDMSDGDPDFSSERVKQQCKQLIMQIKQEEMEDERESCSALSQSCTQKDDLLHTRREKTLRFSMYSKNTMHKSDSNQNRKKSTVSGASKMKLLKSYCNRLPRKTAISSIDQEKKIPRKIQSYKTNERPEEERGIGEVCANDDVKTMMEFLISQEVPIMRNVAKKRTFSTKTINDIPKKFYKLPAPSPSTDAFRKFEVEIKNLHQKVKFLKEMGHPNYYVYIKVLEMMSRKLTEMKAQIQTPQPSEIKKSCEILRKEEMTSLSLKSEFPQNVKLICLFSTDDKDFNKSEHLERENRYDTLELMQQYNTFSYLTNFQGENFETKNLQNNEIGDVDRKDALNSHKRKSHPGLTFLLKEQNPYELSTSIEQSNFSVEPINRCYKILKDSHTINYVMLSLSCNEIPSVVAYRQCFQEYRSSNSLYQMSVKPWLMIERLANTLIDKVIKEIICNEIGIQKITSGLLNLEFQ